MRNWLITSIAVAGILGSSAVALADFTFTAPPGVTDYRLAFVTDAPTLSTSSNIATYNLIVSTEAALNVGLPTTTWSAIVSTTSISAASNVSCGAGCDGSVPIYLVDGTQVATSATALFAGSILTAINKDESGNNVNEYVWTGSNSDGSAVAGAEMGAAGGSSAYGADFNTSGMFFRGVAVSTCCNVGIYAISGNISVSVPEPMTISLLGLGCLAIGLARKFRSKWQLTV